jgi:hypothetical protein
MDDFPDRMIRDELGATSIIYGITAPGGHTFF